MADQPDQVVVASQTTPGHTVIGDDVGARSVYDPPVQSLASVSAESLNNQIRDTLTNGGFDDGTPNVNAGVTQTVTQTAGFPPVVFHTSGFGYTLPFGG